MNLEEVIQKLVGKTIIRIEAEDWDEKWGWLNSLGSVRIWLDDGTQLHSLGEPVGVEFGGRRDPVERIKPGNI